MRIRFPAIVGALILSACLGTPTATSGITYAVHSYSCCAENTGDTAWHAGQHVTLHWTPQSPGTTTDANPHPIGLTVTLTGPFATVNALKLAISQGTKPTGVRTISAAPVSATDRDVVNPASQLDLPADLPPGYYNLGSQATEGTFSQGGAAVVTIVP